jgi:DNA helicase-2/ATP-dependent DNA helicase PcrA
VAITRAKKELILSYAKTRYIFGDVQMQSPSRFLSELPEGEIEKEDINFGGGFGYSESSSSNLVRNPYKTSSSGTSSSSFGGGSINKGFTNSFAGSSFKKSNIVSNVEVKRAPEGLEGKRVFHQKFGYGKVVSVDGNKLEIAFEKSGSKTVMKDFVTAA